MRIFSIDKDNEMIPYNEFDFKDENLESDLEDLLEKNPQYFFEESNILIIGRQVATNLTTYIDLLGIDKSGNALIIELKRDKTPRETIAQLLEYASFIQNIDYDQLNTIYQTYYGADDELDDYHLQYFARDNEEKVSFNKRQKLLIIAQSISKEIKQTAIYLRRAGIDIYCLEFKYFKTKSGEKIISADFVVGGDEYKRTDVKTSTLPKVNENDFMSQLNENGKSVFEELFDFARKTNLHFIWGSKGFSLNYDLNGNKIALFFGYANNSVYKQSIYTGFENISKKSDNPKEIVDFFKEQLLATKMFSKAGKNLKWMLNKNFTSNEVNEFIRIIKEVIKKIEENNRTNLTNKDRLYEATIYPVVERAR